MKRVVLVLCPLALLFAATGCDELALSGLSTDMQAAIASATGSKIDLLASGLGGSGGYGNGTGNGDQLRIQDRLMDGSCDGDGSQYQYGGNGDAGIGSGSQDQLRLRDGSCGDGG